MKTVLINNAKLPHVRRLRSAINGCGARLSFRGAATNSSEIYLINMHSKAYKTVKLKSLTLHLDVIKHYTRFYDREERGKENNNVL